MRYAESYQPCVEPDDTYQARLIVSIAEWIHDGDTVDDVQIDAARIAYNVNAHSPFCIEPEEVRRLAEAAVYYQQTGYIE